MLWEKKVVGMWLEKRTREDKAVSAKIRDDAGNRTLNEMFTKIKDKRHDKVWQSAGNGLS